MGEFAQGKNLDAIVSSHRSNRFLISSLKEEGENLHVANIIFVKCRDAIEQAGKSILFCVYADFVVSRFCRNTTLVFNQSLYLAKTCSSVNPSRN